MISSIVGTLLKKNTKSRLWWAKLAICLVLSNLFFFFLFGGERSEAKPETSPVGWVEVQLRAELLTPFQKGKKVLLIHRGQAARVSGVLDEDINSEGKLTVLVPEAEAPVLFVYDQWEILPYLKSLVLKRRSKGWSHEISY